jgi:hypothetical protein
MGPLFWRKNVIPFVHNDFPIFWLICRGELPAMMTDGMRAAGNRIAHLFSRKRGIEPVTDNRVVRSDTGAPAGQRATAVAEWVHAEQSLVEWVEALGEAMLARNGRRIEHFLGDERSARLPREVREEAMSFTALPPASTRAPIRTLRYAYMLRHLEAFDEEVGQRPSQLELFRERRAALAR